MDKPTTRREKAEELAFSAMLAVIGFLLMAVMSACAVWVSL